MFAIAGMSGTRKAISKVSREKERSLDNSTARANPVNSSICHGKKVKLPDCEASCQNVFVRKKCRF